MSNEAQEPKEYFIQKRGYYYRPDNCGYTDRPILAGLYTEAEAIDTTHPNGDDGPRDGMRYFHESQCRDADYLVFKEQQVRITELEAQLAKVTAELAVAEANINLKADWIEATINDMAAQHDAIPRAYRMGLGDAAEIADACDLGVKGNVGDRVARQIARNVRATPTPADLVERVMKETGQ